MTYDKIALFTDLDGTLLNSKREVSPENLAALHRFVSDGGAFGISTGRAPSNALDVLPPLPINTWSVFLNGAAGDISTRFTRREQSFAECARMGEMVADRIRALLENAPEMQPQPLKGVCRRVRLPCS